ncbi:hypothetical protein [Myceligenerans pegani]|uniref:Uncharacterized protein n=1 Tax=Myceligenerans pegani TaxID=2776917 RepID=A0ABR9MXR2_9MICO|nr:hypothetical protein [Myceligenerans sp. TRM 65318]MBE1876167.1 hypothetical protein [Myceligenerans sp. TRM 65318]MBE3018438.1 hypothetical protein [Myceligenerans sp. TRM 65318]
MSADAERATLTPNAHVVITSGRFAWMAGRLTGTSAERAGVDLGVSIDGGNGIVSVPVWAVREVER